MNFKGLITVILIVFFLSNFSFGQEIDSLSQKKISVSDSLVHQKELEKSAFFETDISVDSLAEEETSFTDSTTEIQENIRFFAPALFIDYGKIFTLPFKFETKAEVGVELLFINKIPIIAEFGYASLKPSYAYDTGKYESKGYYGRVGAGYLVQITPKNKIGLTARYAMSFFSEKAENVILNKKLPNEQNFDFERKDLRASWAEMVIYSDKKINKFMSIGMNIRLRFLINTKKLMPEVHSIPGYGISKNKVFPALNLFVRIGF